MNRPLHMTPAEATALPVGSLSLPLAAREVPSVSSDTLLRGARELVIRHQGGEYRLRLTRNDKLILTK